MLVSANQICCRRDMTGCKHQQRICTYTDEDELSALQLTSTCLQKGCHCHQVTSMLYVDPDSDHHSMTGLGQVTVPAVSQLAYTVLSEE